MTKHPTENYCRCAECQFQWWDDHADTWPTCPACGAGDLRQEARAIVARITPAWRAPQEGEPLSAYVGRYLTRLENT